MSDRLAVFNRGRIEQIGTPADVYEQPATPFVAGFVGTRNLLTGEAARAVIGEDGVFTVRPEKIRLAEPDPPAADDEARRGARSARSSTSGRTRATSSRSTRAASWSSRSRTCETSSMEALTAQGRPVRLIWKRRHVLRLARSQESTGSNGGGDRRPSAVRQLRIPCAGRGDRPAAAAACGRRERLSRARRTMQRVGAGEGALNLVIWAGYAERGAADPAYDWVTPFEDEDRLQGQHDRHDRLEQRRVADPVGRVRRHLRVRRRDRPRLIPAASSPRSTRRCCRTTPTCSLASRTCRTTPSTASTTASRTAAARTCSAYNTETCHDRAHQLGSDLGRRRRLQGQDQHLRLVDLHRRRGAAPDGDAARPGHQNPYQLTQAQFDAAIALLQAAGGQRAAVLGRRRPTRSPRTTAGDVVIGTTWQYQVNLLAGREQPIEAILPDEGSTGWSDTWMMYSEAAASELHAHVDGPHDVG